MSQLSLSNISKVYSNGYHAIDNASVEIETGEFVVFVGPSGCGKSTLLRMIAGLEDVSGGEITLAGQRVNDLDPASRDIAMVFQNYALYPHMTVYKNLAYGLINRKIDKAEIDRRVQDAASMLQLSEYLDRKPNQLSGGQRQRVAMGRAIVREPKAFLFDEPLSNLDAKLRNKMRLEIKSLQRRLGITSVYVTHDQVEAMTMADKIVVINRGNIEQIGTPHEIYHNPNSLFVATFMGAPAMNILPVRISNQQLHLCDDQIISYPHDCSYGEYQLGIRPEALNIVDPGTPDAFSVTVSIVEDLGAQRVIHCQLCTEHITLTTSLTSIRSGQTLHLQADPDLMYLFTPAGERVLTRQVQEQAA